MSIHSSYPVRGKVYLAAAILKLLRLDDTPCFQFMHEGYTATIQDSHLTEDELLTVPGFGDTQWKYIRTTEEWIPVFRAVQPEAVVACVDIYKSRDDGFWVTPKGFPRPHADEEQS